VGSGCLQCCHVGSWEPPCGPKPGMTNVGLLCREGWDGKRESQNKPGGMGTGRRWHSAESHPLYSVPRPKRRPRGMAATPGSRGKKLHTHTSPAADGRDQTLREPSLGQHCTTGSFPVWVILIHTPVSRAACPHPHLPNSLALHAGWVPPSAFQRHQFHSPGCHRPVSPSGWDCAQEHRKET
jgi:hypothetical protein